MEIRRINPVRHRTGLVFGSMNKIFSSRTSKLHYTRSGSMVKGPADSQTIIKELLGFIKQTKRTKKLEIIAQVSQVMIEIPCGKKKVLRNDDFSSVVPRIKGRSSPTKTKNPYNLQRIDQILRTHSVNIS